MGLLSLGEPLSWQETEKVCDYIKEHGIIQFLNIYTSLKDRVGDCLKWGDEVEYLLIEFDHQNKKANLKLGCEEYVDVLSENERKGMDVEVLWRPEFASFQSEATPGRPYGGLLAHFNLVEPNMKLRRQQMQNLIKQSKNGDNCKLMSLTSYPRLGCPPNFTSPPINYTTETLHQQNNYTKSIFFPEQCINSHPRFKTLANNIRSRKGRKVEINVPIFKDKNTPKNFIDPLVLQSNNEDSIKNGVKPDMIYLDSMGFGMGMSCLQMTFQAQNIEEARLLYDQLNSLGPLVLALSASTPIFRGYLADIDARWKVICASVDDRKPNENIRKSRYDTVDAYLHPTSQFCNDVDLEINDQAYKKLKENGIDDILAKHIAHLWIRDPISVFAENLKVDDNTSSDHFENIQSTNWQSMRFKPPPPNSNIGWRVEFRTTDLQITDFENAAFVVFVVLVTRAMLASNARTVMPITKVDENMKRAHNRDAINNTKFFWRTNFNDTVQNINDLNLKEMTLDQIVNGDGDGLIDLIYSYLADLDVDIATFYNLDVYLNFISKRAKGEFITNAKYIRNFIQNHPKYNFDSVVSEEINYDLLVNLNEITDGKIKSSQHNMFEDRCCPDNEKESIGFKSLTPGTRRVYGKSVSHNDK